MGTECNAECELHNGKTDTIQHRLSECYRGAQIEDTKTRRDYKEVLFQGDVWPEVLMRDRNVGDFEYGIVTRIGEDLHTYKTCPAFIFMMGVIIYTDGSCWFSNSRFARGSGAAVQRITEEEGEVYRTVSWMIPEAMMHCSFTGEWVVLLLAVLHHGRQNQRMEFMTDSAALQQGWCKVKSRGGVGFTGRWDGLHRQLLERCDESGITETSLLKVKAHRKKVDGIDEADKANIRGNGVADYAANQCMARHYGDKAMDEAVKEEKGYIKVVSQIVEALMQARKDFPDVPRPGKNDRIWEAQHKKAVNGGSRHRLRF